MGGDLGPAAIFGEKEVLIGEPLELRGVIPRMQDAGVKAIVGSEVCDGYGRHAGGRVSKRPASGGNEETRMANEE